MIPYLMLIFLPLIFLFVALQRQQARGATTIILTRKAAENNLLIPVFFIIFYLLLILRHESVGVDLVNYKMHFESMAYFNFKQAFVREGDILYNIFVWLISRITHDFRIFLALVAATILLPIARVYAEDREYGALKMIIFINYLLFI